MDDILLIDATERYRNGEMSPQEIAYFEELRKNNPEVDQVFVEHTFFLNQLENSADRKALKHTLHEVENDLVNEGILSKKQLKGNAKVVYLWNRYRRTIAVAASIAIFFSIFTAALVSNYTGNKKVGNLTPLVNNKLNNVDNKLNRVEDKLNDLESKINNASGKPAKVPFVASFRATGFLIDGSGYILTSAHVINNASNLVVENKRGEQYIALPVYVNKITDLAILKVTDSSFKKIHSLPYPIPKYAPELGEQIFTLGYPREEVVYGEGYLSSKLGYSGDTTSYQISISANPGNSGGPVINRNGEIIGVISSKETNADGVVFAVRSKNIYRAVDEIRKTENIRMPSGNSSIKGLNRVQQIRKMEDCVYMVKGN
ncbi:hypothetical protein BH09BAC2_BH09BAC2_10380 [soil metagenome]